jgi:hypothetical protein
MAESGSIVEIRAGASQRPLLELRPGEVVQPMSIGRVGMWPVDAPGVLDVHAYVYFDGTALFIQSADESNPAKGNGQAIATTWQQIEIPCTIEIGRARLVYRTLDEGDDDDQTVAQAVQIPAARPSQPQPQFSPNSGAFSNRSKTDSDATRLAPMSTREPDPTVVSPLEMTGTPIIGVPKARPAAGMKAFSTDVMPQSQPTAVGAPPAPPQNAGYQAFGSVQVAVPPPPPPPMVQTLNAPMQQPMMQMQQPMQMQQQPMMMPMQQQPMMMPMQPGYAGAPGPMQMPPGMMPMQQGMMNVPPQQGMDTNKLRTGELKGFARAKAEWDAMPPIRKLILGLFPGVAILAWFMLFDDEPQQQVRRPKGQPSASASVVATATTPPTTTAPPTTNTIVAPPPTVLTVATVVPTATIAPPPIASVAPLPKGKSTLERQAIDLVALGQYTKAAEVYDQLAQQHPEQPVYREAARILRSR